MKFDKIYFLGIGGIGMSALARYFLHEGCAVAGYDRTRSSLTDALSGEGAAIHYEDDPSLIPDAFRDAESTMVVYTPAIPADHSEWEWFRRGGFTIEKRSQMLGHLCHDKLVMAVAGTHGKTTTTTLAAWLNHKASGEGSAFLGGISRNFGSNLVLGGGRRLAVEADEYDRSFLRLSPDIAVVTAADADHLDIYGTLEAVHEAFAQFIAQIRPGGALIIKQGVELRFDNPSIGIYRYSLDCGGDFYACNIRPAEEGHCLYDIVTPDGIIADCRLGIPGMVNIENSIAAVAALWCADRRESKPFDHDAVREALATFEGVKRRFELYINTPRQVYVDDYAHHPEELRAAITSLKAMFPGRRLTAVFQPHLFTRTRDLADGFAEALSLADQVVLLPIYPAREQPIEGIVSEIIGDRLTVPWRICMREQLAETLAAMTTDVVATFGAGNIDACCDAVALTLKRKS
ncbi:MAG: UDP-N-acetylmuramate--L-alanine ligase [Alistipes sp.]|mgnify:FL=1|nr:UDP-N-acetylmuramate--L-alanine ligase [Alistipes sp.]